MFENFNVWQCLGKMIDVFVLVYIPWRIFPSKASAQHKRCGFVLPFLIIFMVLYGFDILFQPSELLYTLALWTFLGFSYVFLYFHAQVYLKIVILCACICCTMLMHILVVTSLTLLTGTFMIFTWQHILVEMLLLPLLVYYLCRVSYIPKINLPSRFGILMAALMLILTLVMNAIRTSGVNSAMLYKFEASIIVSTIVFYLYYLFFRVSKEYEGKYNYILLSQTMNIQKKSLEESTEVYNRMKHLRHELKNHIFYMKTLLEQKNYDSLDDYFKQIYGQEYEIDMLESGNNVINTILNQKIAFAKSKNIPVIVGAVLPETLGIDESHICAVISNLLDNAIEACEHVSDPKIFVTVQQKEKYIHIICKNTVAFDVLKENAKLTTTKKTPNHGIGLQVVHDIVKTYDGMIDFQMEESTFVVKVMLKSRV